MLLLMMSPCCSGWCDFRLALFVSAALIEIRYSCRAIVWCSHFQVWCSELMRYRIPTQSRLQLKGIPFNWPDVRTKWVCYVQPCTFSLLFFLSHTLYLFPTTLVHFHSLLALFSFPTNANCQTDVCDDPNGTQYANVAKRRDIGNLEQKYSETLEARSC